MKGDNPKASTGRKAAYLKSMMETMRKLSDSDFVSAALVLLDGSLDAALCDEMKRRWPDEYQVREKGDKGLFKMLQGYSDEELVKYTRNLLRKRPIEILGAKHCAWLQYCASVERLRRACKEEEDAERAEIGRAHV